MLMDAAAKDFGTDAERISALAARLNRFSRPNVVPVGALLICDPWKMAMLA